MAFQSNAEPQVDRRDRKQRKADKLEDAADELFKQAEANPDRKEKLTLKRVKYLKKAAALCPHNTRRIYNLALAEQQLAGMLEGRKSTKLIDQALDRMRTCDQMSGTHPLVIWLLNKLLTDKAGMVNRYETGQDADALIPLYNEIIENSNRVIHLTSAEPDELEEAQFSMALGYANRGMLQEGQERSESFEKAADCFGTLAEKNSKNVSVLYNYGNALLDTAKTHEGPVRQAWLDRSLVEHKKMMVLVRQFENTPDGELDEEVLVDEKTASSARYNHACVLSIVGRHDEAYAEIEHMLKAETHTPKEFHRDPDFDSMREQARFKELVGEQSQ